MKINYVKTIGFRKFEKVFEANLFDNTIITGKNRSGKTNLLSAIVNAFLGTNLSGDEKSCLINKKCDASLIELHFIDNRGIKHILIRGKHKFNNNMNFITLDGKNIKQTDLVSFYKDKKLFLSIMNPLYFLSKKPAEQKEMLDTYLSDIRPKVVFDSLEPKQQRKLIDKYYKGKRQYEELSEDDKEEFINTTMLNIPMDISYNNLSNEEQKILEGIPHDIPTFISELNADISRSENVITTIDGKIEYAQNIAEEQLPNYKQFEKEEELSLARQELDFLNRNQNISNKEKQKNLINDLEKNILEKETESQELIKKMTEGKKEYYNIKNGKESCCPTCKQTIKDISKNITIANMHKELLGYYDKNNLLVSQLKDLKSKLSIERCKYHALEGTPTIETSKRITIVKENIEQLEKEKLEVEKFNSQITSKEDNIKNAKLNIDKLNEEKKSHNKNIELANKAKKVAQKLYILYIEEKMKLAKQYLRDVDIKYYSVLKGTGEIKEDFVITYKNNLLSDLSRSEKFATALEFANMFNHIGRVNFPLFIDDYESYTDYNFIKEYGKDTQLLLAEVQKGQALKIADYNNAKDFKLLKPTIKGCKTMKIVQRDNSVIKKVA